MQNDIQFQYTEADFRSFMGYHYLKGAGRKTIIVMVLFAALVGLWPIYQGGLSLVAIGSALFWMLFIFGIWYFTLRFTTNRVFKANPQMLEKRRFSFDASGVRMQGETFSSDYQWQGFQRIGETPHYFFLFTSGISAIILPKRIFSPEQMADFRKVAALV